MLLVRPWLVITIPRDTCLSLFIPVWINFRPLMTIPWPTAHIAILQVSRFILSAMVLGTVIVERILTLTGAAILPQ